jgi:23S rRNA (uracil1939-C5)-methyltransferase
VAGVPTLTLEVDGVQLRASPRAFYQVNLEANGLLVAWVREQVLQRRPERVLDLYAGIGNLSLPLAARGVPVAAVESEGQAVADLRHTAQRWSHVSAIVQRVERFDPSREAFDVVLLDPPRAGAPGILPRVVRNRPRAIVYVSCHAPSAARDLRKIRGRGYELVATRCFDLFPDTHHLETVLVLERR